ncbi:LysE family transporter [Aureitalea marina]|uniref:Lysine transporter LysE n=1 Tax=Aureitalea marina TaxID=930804 RepID=A0A2S7KR92_9FLAO|nr:LysE family transporter [Aureitalea marina]PQB05108.1 hypothetical protein BST85_09555 [Aureitalea marina]
MIILFLLIGLILAAVGGAPLGASNIAVVSAATSGNQIRARRLILGAGLGEVALAFLAVCYSSLLAEFFQMNPWVQASFIGLFFLVGIGFLLATRLRHFPKVKTPKLPETALSSGFLLAFLNPPVLLFWILAIGLSSRYLLPISDQSSILVLSLFFLGVMLGKAMILQAYALYGKRIQERGAGDKNKLYRLIGVVLIVLSTLQGLRFFLI